MYIIGRVISALRALPERTRFFLAGVVLFLAGIFVFISWSALTASHFASLSRVFAPPGGEISDSQKDLENPGNIFEQLKSGFRDMRSLFRGGILPDLSPDSAPKSGREESEQEAAPLPSFGNSTFDKGGEESATSSSGVPFPANSGSNTRTIPGSPNP